VPEKIKIYREGTAGEPKFPGDYDITRQAVLQVTDIKTNRNKYYALELHTASDKFRLFTHYGRTDDLETGKKGVRETRYFSNLADAEKEYGRIYKQKTGKSKGYKELSLASSKIGSDKARGSSSGDVDEGTLERIASEEKAKPAKSKLCSDIQSFTRYIYEEATNALTSTISAKITAQGIETPLGVLTLGQIDKGQSILDDIYKYVEKKPTPSVVEALTDLSGDFYTLIPHRIGRSRAAATQAIIRDLASFSQKQETLQLMRDMLSVNGEGSNVLFKDEVDEKYQALGCDVRWIDPKGPEFNDLQGFVQNSQVKRKGIKVVRAYGLMRQAEHTVFTGDLSNQQMLFHGSRPSNWMGILSHGILLPKVVLSMGGKRTDAGWLGHGIYFGDAICTTVYYTQPGKRKTRLAAVARVALGKTKKYRKITYGLAGPPSGYDSCHGVRGSQFADDEFVVYKQEQQRLDYLIEYTA